MSRSILTLCLIVVAAFALGSNAASAEPTEAPSAPPAPPHTTMAADEEQWWERYAEARVLFLAERYAEAATVFESLRTTATNTEQKRLAAELEMIARALAGAHAALQLDQRRTGDELSLLYSTAFVYGFGTSAWVALQTRPEHFAGAVLPFAVLTSASVGAVAVADNHRPLPRGVPQSISSGLYLGFIEGVWIVGLQHADATRRGDGHWGSARVSTVLWSGATAGAITGGLVGDALRPEPGNVSFVTSTALWGGIVSGLGGAALQSDVDLRGGVAFLAAGVGYNVGLGAGLFLAPSEPLSVARVRITDVAGLGGALFGSGSYVAFAGDNADPRIGFGAAAVGASVGLGLGWWLTESIRPVKPRSTPIDNVTLAPMVTPVPGGFTVGVVGGM